MYVEIVNDAVLSVCGQRLQHSLYRESVQLMSGDVMMERALNRDIVVTVSIIVLMAPTNSTAVRFVLLLCCPTGFQ